MENTTKNTFAVYFFLKKRGEKKKKNDGKIQPKTIWKKKNIQCRITINGDPVDFASFIFVDPQKWHSKWKIHSYLPPSVHFKVIP
ncbi:MAG TPA: hypothetical protein DFK15_15020 [Butyricimonas sp.]|nr:hypothetical protein [Butyricimonas sp.]HCH90591.1 hypothetical protein [Butyricimonas sp.]